MKILIYGINYSPELTGIGKYTSEMAEWLSNNNYDVDVITGMPYYPEWKIHKEYKHSLWKKEVKNGVNIFRCPLYVPKNVNSIKRIVHELSFLFTSCFRWIGCLFKKNYDLIICINPPFHLSIYPFLYSCFKKTKIVTHIQDLQIDAAKDLNMLGNNTAINFMLKLESFFLNRSDYISTLTDGMKNKISHKGIKDEKIIIFPNWVDIENINVLSKDKSLRSKFHLRNDDFIILYSGNIGKKQGLDLLLEVADDYRNNDKIKFLIVGSGVELPNLKQIASDKKLDNVHFHPLQPYHLLPSLLATADVHIILQKKGASDLVMPSKLTGILASGGCAIVSAEKYSSLYRIIEENNIGLLCGPESHSDLKKIIDKALTYNLTTIKNNARKYAVKNLSQDYIMLSFMKNIKCK